MDANTLAALHATDFPQIDGSEAQATAAELDESAFPSLASSASAPLGAAAAPGRTHMPQTPLRTAAKASSRASSGGGGAALLVTEIVDVPNANLLIHQRRIVPADVARSAQAKSGVSLIDVSTSKRANTITFVVKGSREAVARARREIVSALSVKVTTSVRVPASAVRFLIGTKGQTLAGIQSRSGAAIQLPPREANAAEDCSVSITGDAESCARARAEILRIVDDKVSVQRVTVRVAAIGARWWAFMDPVVESLRQQGVVTPRISVNVPRPSWIIPSPAEDDTIASGDAITVTGGKGQVDAVVRELVAAHAHMSRTHKTLLVQVQKRQHRYLLLRDPETRMIPLMTILEDTGCHVQVAPAASSRDESVLIRGPEPQLLGALDRVMQVASTFKHVRVDLTAIHRAAPFPEHHARNVFRYLVATGLLRSIEADHRVEFSLVGYDAGSIVPPPTGILLLELSGRSSQDLDAAANRLIATASRLAPYHVDVVHIPGVATSRILSPNSRRLTHIRNQCGVYVLASDEGCILNDKTELLRPLSGGNADEIVLVFECLPTAYAAMNGTSTDPTSSRFLHNLRMPAPSPLVSSQHLVGARTALLHAVRESASHAMEKLEISAADQASLLSSDRSSLRPELCPENDECVVLLSSIQKPSTTPLDANQIFLRGPARDIAAIKERILAAVDVARQDELLRNYSEAFTIKPIALPHIIGKGGAGLKRIGDKFNVAVDLDAPGKDGKGKNAAAGEEQPATVSIRGYKDDVRAARQHIADLSASLVDQVSITLNVPLRFHSALIGPGGRFVRRLEDKHNVRILFPKAPTHGHDDDESDDADRDVSRNQSPDDVVIRGGRVGVNAAKAEIVEVVEYEKALGYTETFEIPHSTLRHVVGKGGSRINEIKDEHNVRIDIERKAGDGQRQEDDSSDGDKPTGSAPRSTRVTVRGSKDAVKKAREAILTVVDEQESIVTLTMTIPSKYHKYLIGPGGQRIRDIQTSALGEFIAGMVIFPRIRAGESEASNRVTLKGEREKVHTLRDHLLQIVEEQDKMITIVVSVPGEDRPAIIGRNAQGLRDLQSQHSVEIDISKDRELANEFKVRGLPEACEAAAAEIRSKIRAVAMVKVAEKFHGALAGTNGVNFRRLRKDFDVIVDHPTEDAVSEDARSIGDCSDGKVILWRLRGPAERITASIEWLVKRFDEAMRFTHTEDLLVPSEFHRHILGRGGATVQNIQAKTGCRIELPRLKGGRSASDVIVVSGSEEGVQQARAMIEEIMHSVNKQIDGKGQSDNDEDEALSDDSMSGYGVVEN